MKNIAQKADASENPLTALELYFKRDYFAGIKFKDQYLRNTIPQLQRVLKDKNVPEGQRIDFCADLGHIIFYAQVHGFIDENYQHKGLRRSKQPQYEKHLIWELPRIIKKNGLEQYLEQDNQ